MLKRKEEREKVHFLSYFIQPGKLTKKFLYVHARDSESDAAEGEIHIFPDSLLFLPIKCCRINGRSGIYALCTDEPVTV